MTEGASVMAVELCGAKMLAPYFGSSIYVWAAVLAVTLFGLASGYFFGAKLSEKEKEGNKLLTVLFAACLGMLAMIPFFHYVVPAISLLPLIPAVILSSVIILFIPVFFLGAASPLFIHNILSFEQQGGKVSGKVYGYSTLGGILATFLCGFYLIPEWGLPVTLSVFATGLFLITLFTMKLFNKWMIPVFLLFLFSVSKLFYLKSPNELYCEHGIPGEVVVEEHVTKNDTLRRLLINRVVQSEVSNRSTYKLPYLRVMDSLIPFSDNKSKVLLLGLGGGTLANMLSNKNYKVQAVEFDERIISAAKKYFDLDKSVIVACEDARRYLNRCKDTFDLILFDVFKAEEQPAHVITIESLSEIKKNLTRSANILINWHGYDDDELGEGTQVLLNTFHFSGFTTTLIPTGSNPHYRNIIIQAAYTGQQSYSGVKLNTDSRPLLEKANARANLSWRKNYLHYYQSITP